MPFLYDVFTAVTTNVLTVLTLVAMYCVCAFAWSHYCEYRRLCAIRNATTKTFSDMFRSCVYNIGFQLGPQLLKLFFAPRSTHMRPMSCPNTTRQTPCNRRNSVNKVIRNVIREVMPIILETTTPKQSVPKQTTPVQSASKQTTPVQSTTTLPSVAPTPVNTPTCSPKPKRKTTPKNDVNIGQLLNTLLGSMTKSTKPASKPASEPASESASKPASEPVSKLVSEPVSELASKPTPEAVSDTKSVTISKPMVTNNPTEAKTVNHTEVDQVERMIKQTQKLEQLSESESDTTEWGDDRVSSPIFDLTASAPPGTVFVNREPTEYAKN